MLLKRGIGKDNGQTDPIRKHFSECCFNAVFSLSRHCLKPPVDFLDEYCIFFSFFSFNDLVRAQAILFFLHSAFFPRSIFWPPQVLGSKNYTFGETKQKRERTRRRSSRIYVRLTEPQEGCCKKILDPKYENETGSSS